MLWYYLLCWLTMEWCMYYSVKRPRQNIYINCQNIYINCHGPVKKTIKGISTLKYFFSSLDCIWCTHYYRSIFLYANVFNPCIYSCIYPDKCFLPQRFTYFVKDSSCQSKSGLIRLLSRVLSVKKEAQCIRCFFSCELVL